MPIISMRTVDKRCDQALRPRGLRPPEGGHQPVAVVRRDRGDDRYDAELDEHDLAVGRRRQRAERTDLLVRQDSARDADGDDRKRRES